MSNERRIWLPFSTIDWTCNPSALSTHGNDERCLGQTGPDVPLWRKAPRCDITRKSVSSLSHVHDTLTPCVPTCASEDVASTRMMVVGDMERRLR